MCIGNCNIARYVYYTDAHIKQSIAEVFFMRFFTVMQKVYHCAEGNGSTVEGVLESMLLRGLPVDLFCMLLQTITPRVCFVALGILE